MKDTKKTKTKGNQTVPLKLKSDVANIRFLVENYYDIQDNRISAEGRNRSWLQIYKVTNAQQKIYKESITDKFIDIEKWTYKEIKKAVEKHPLWTDWLVDVKGIGPALAGGFIAWIGNIERFATISALNSYCGLACDDKGNAIRKTKGVKSNWHSRLKTHVWKAETAFVKTKGEYRAYYDKVKAAYQKKYPKKVDTGKKSKEGKRIFKYSKGHINSMAMRKTGKLFLSHLWLTWRDLEGLPTRSPYALDKLGHTTFIPPFRDKKKGK